MTDVTTNQSFQERMFARIRDNMGDMMTDEDLKKIVETAVQKSFFELKKGPRYDSPVGPSVFEELVRSAMQDRLEAAAKASVDAWIAEHPEDYAKALEAALAKGVFELFSQHFEFLIRVPMQNLAFQLQNTGALPR